MPNLQQLALLALQKNPSIANTPQGRQFAQILQSGDEAAGQQMARNLCQSYGVTVDEATKEAAKFFNIPM